MDNHIIPKVAYIPLEYTLSVDKFLGLWNELEDVGEPTQKDYDEWFLDGVKVYFYEWFLDGAKVYFYRMRGNIEDSIRLIEDN